LFWWKIDIPSEGNHTFFALPCPNLTRLQTLSCFFCSSLSELDSASDTLSLFLLFLVRSQLGFGHTLAFSALPCPKSTRLQTLSCFFSSSLSEVNSASDTLSLFLLFLVRSQLGFGPTLSFSALPCLKSARLQTLSLFFSSSLSELELIIKPLLFMVRFIPIYSKSSINLFH
jgi:hypothetical protein